MIAFASTRPVKVYIIAEVSLWCWGGHSICEVRRVLAQNRIWRVVSSEEFSHHRSIRGDGSTDETSNILAYWILVIVLATFLVGDYSRKLKNF